MSLWSSLGNALGTNKPDFAAKLGNVISGAVGALQSGGGGSTPTSVGGATALSSSPTSNSFSNMGLGSSPSAGYLTPVLLVVGVLLFFMMSKKK